jgi:hypothetical protein
MDRIHLTQDRDQWRAGVSELSGSMKCWEIFE